MSQLLRHHLEQILPLTDDEFALVLAHFTSQRFQRHDFIFQAGEPIRHFYFVVAGLLKLTYTSEAGRQHIVSFATEQWWETDLPAFYTQVPATMALQCLENTEVLCLALADYRHLCATFPRIEHFFLEKSIFGYMAAQRRILSLLTSSARERYEQLRHQRPALLQRVPKTLLAAYLGVSRETLSRLAT